MPEAINPTGHRIGVRLLSWEAYPHLPTSPYAARDHAVKVAGMLTDVEALKLCVSELVTNSFRHADEGPITVYLWHLYLEGLLRCEVVDPGGRTIPHVVDADDGEANGRGLWVIAQVAITWGHYRDEAGLTTWAVLPASKVYLERRGPLVAAALTPGSKMTSIDLCPTCCPRCGQCLIKWRAYALLECLIVDFWKCLNCSCEFQTTSRDEYSDENSLMSSDRMPAMQAPVRPTTWARSVLRFLRR